MKKNLSSTSATSEQSHHYEKLYCSHQKTRHQKLFSQIKSQKLPVLSMTRTRSSCLELLSVNPLGVLSVSGKDPPGVFGGASFVSFCSESSSSVVSAFDDASWNAEKLRKVCKHYFEKDCHLNIMYFIYY